MPRVREFEDQTMVLISLYNQNKNMKEKTSLSVVKKSLPANQYVHLLLLQFTTFKVHLKKYVNTVDFQ